ncbi:ribonuclease Oy-like protein [Leptotrombidium deliense]|uniref:Ribonuclease Oy-like protein n=1 Tax=Leptotrombidium deliense TaxID=299467 RepID=A0A443SBD8_9ACAR|nr:ribonuclease Oy-like protein [Leptotrombidium deliense]
MHALIVFTSNLAQKESEDNLCPKVTFDFIDLSLQWSPGLCAFKKCNPHQKKWTIHGAWPQNNRGRHPESCCFNRFLNDTVLRKLHSDLREHWTSLYGNEKKFWKHEWAKHGTCSYATKQLQGQENYFSQSIKLFKKLDLLTWLSKHSITPQPLGSKSAYQLENIRNAVRNHFGKRVRFSCGVLNNNNSQQTAILQEVHFCFDKNSLQPVDCVRNDDAECGNQGVHFIN